MNKVICACCNKHTTNYSEYVYKTLGIYICIYCEIEREYEIDQMVDARTL